MRLLNPTRYRRWTVAQRTQAKRPLTSNFEKIKPTAARGPRAAPATGPPIYVAGRSAPGHGPAILDDRRHIADHGDPWVTRKRQFGRDLDLTFPAQPSAQHLTQRR